MSGGFITKDFLLETKTARTLYFDFAAGLPIIDYHSHLPPQDVAHDRVFNDISEIWLEGDHYKWRAMRANGVDESYCTGRKSAQEKFMQWAATVPRTLRNPLYHWTHMELKNPFGIDRLLDSGSAPEIFREVNQQLQTRYSVRRLLLHFQVEVICTSDEPLDTLKHHRALATEGFPVKVLPSFRPDTALLVERPEIHRPFLGELAAAAGFAVTDFESFIAALRKRHDYFNEHGCRLSDHGWVRVYDLDYTTDQIEAVFKKILSGDALAADDVARFRTAAQYELALMDHEENWTQMFHVGALRNVNSRRFRELGRNTGFDTMGDTELASGLARFLDRLDRDDRLARTIIFNLNPKDNTAFAAMIGNFQDGRIPGKVQYGPAWWFLDNRDNMIDQMNALSTQGLLSRFVGMVTDSRSFLSFSRHEYFRRILCNLLGSEAERGLLPADMDLLGKTVQDICYHNAKAYFLF